MILEFNYNTSLTLLKREKKYCTYNIRIQFATLKKSFFGTFPPLYIILIRKTARFTHIFSIKYISLTLNCGKCCRSLLSSLLMWWSDLHTKHLWPKAEMVKKKKNYCKFSCRGETCGGQNQLSPLQSQNDFSPHSFGIFRQFPRSVHLFLTARRITYVYP